MVISPGEMETNEPKEADPDELPPIESMVIDVPNQESKEADHTVYRHLDFTMVPKHRDNFGSFVFHAPAAGTPAAQALEANAAIKVSKVSKGLHKLRGLKRPKLKSLNVVKKINKTTKVKRDRKHFSTNFKGKVIDGVHELYTLTAGMMLGIRYSIGRNHTAENNHVEMADFSYVEKVFFPPKGNNEPPHITPQHSLAHTFKFKSYCPKVFQRLRDFFGIDAASYMLSVCGDYNFVEFISNSKSGQFFFYSHDGKYMIKTQTKEENKFLKRILPHYYKFLTENPYSMLVQILGMHRVKMYHLRRKVHFVIMRSVFDSPVQIHTIYDLKGSLIGRAATERERSSGGVLKDNDLITDKRAIHLGVKKAAFMDQLEKDAMFLASLNIMDYSLLVGFHDRTKRVHPSTLLQANTLSNAGAGATAATVVAGGGVPVGGVTNVPASSLKHLASDNNMTNRSNTPFRRSIHVATMPDSDQEGGGGGGGQYSNLASMSMDPNGNNFETPVKQSQESPSRKIAKRTSASGDNFNSSGGSNKEAPPSNGVTPVKQRSSRKLSNKSNDGVEVSASLSASTSEKNGTTNGVTISASEISVSNVDVAIVEPEVSPRTDASFGSMYVNREKARRFKKTFVHAANGSAAKTNGNNTGNRKHFVHHSSVHQIDMRRRSSSSSNDEYSGHITSDDFVTPDKPKRNSRTSANGESAANGSGAEDGEADVSEGEGGEYYYEEDDDGSYEEEEEEEEEEGEQFDFLDEGDSVLDANELDDQVDGHESINTVHWSKNIGYSKEHFAIYTRQPVVEDGLGAMGPEGGQLHEVFRSSVSSRKSSEKKPEYTYGPGATDRKPWTSRKDGGINSRGAQGRGDDIYYLGIIDILQQYNTNKRIETFVKGLTNDKTQISSVDALSYAKRFVAFMGEHID